MLVWKWPIIPILAEDIHHTSNATPAVPIDYFERAGVQNVACAGCARRDTHSLKRQRTWAGESTERRPGFASDKDGGPTRSFEQDHV